MYLQNKKYKARESTEHDYCKRFVAKILTDIGRIRNRKCAYIEYPIVNIGLQGIILLDEVFAECRIEREKIIKNERVPQLDEEEFVPTYDCCKKYLGKPPVRVVDIACPWKGCITEIWEITKSNPLTKKKVEEICKTIYDITGIIPEIYEIRTKDILEISDIYEDPYKIYEEELRVKAKKWTYV